MPAFIKEVQTAKAANPGWEPRLYITTTCASPLILALAGAGGRHLHSASGDLLDVGNPTFMDANPRQCVHRVHDGLGNADNTTAAAGWMIGEVTVAILNQAAAPPTA